LPQGVGKFAREQEVNMLSRSLTAANLIHVLANARSWLTGVLSNFVLHGYDPDTCAIRIGIKGNGIAPNYKIEEPDKSVTVQIRGRKYELTMTPARIFNGRNNNEMAELYDLERHDENWTATTIRFDEAKALLANLS
jgi:hypothetical protein